MALPSGQLEWLETNSLGSFCLGSLDASYAASTTRC